MGFSDYLSKSIVLLTAARSTDLDLRVGEAVIAVARALQSRRPLLICGNGGSASDALHISGELVGRYLKERPAYKAVALSANPAVLTAWSNDYDYDTVFSRQVEALGEKGGVLLGISTSGNSANVVLALRRARAMSMTTIALTGQGGGKCAAEADILLEVPSSQTPHIQEVHVCIYHYLCQQVEEKLTGGPGAA